MFDPRKEVRAERALIVGHYQTLDAAEPDLALDELASLVEAAGGVVAGRSYQRGRPGTSSISPATFVGKGKAEEMGNLAESLEASIVVFDNELSPAQIRELEKVMGRKVIDRSELILDIFASRARTREAKLQVELAQLEYTAPRLRGMWTHLERQAGTGGSGVGMGMKGPGEKQIEIDRRIVGAKVTQLKGELGKIHGRRKREVKARGRTTFTVGLVGYTNAGKSTLMNAVTDAETYSADQLFATLDTKTRRWRVKPGAEVALSDTVGFVRNLPHHLVASFRSTLEEAIHAHLLLHVVDASHPQALEQVEAVEKVLVELGCDLSRSLPVLNKVDQVTDFDAFELLKRRLPGAVTISAKEGTGLRELAESVVLRRMDHWVTLTLQGQAGDGRLHAFVRARGLVREERYDETVWHAEVELPKVDLPELRRMENVTISVGAHSSTSVTSD